MVRKAYEYIIFVLIIENNSIMYLYIFIFTEHNPKTSVILCVTRLTIKNKHVNV